MAFRERSAREAVRFASTVVDPRRSHVRPPFLLLAAALHSSSTSDSRRFPRRGPMVRWPRKTISMFTADVSLAAGRPWPTSSAQFGLDVVAASSVDPPLVAKHPVLLMAGLPEPAERKKNCE